MSKKTVAMFVLVLVNVVVFTVAFKYLSGELAYRAEKSFTARGIDAYLDEVPLDGDDL